MHRSIKKLSLVSWLVILVPLFVRPVVSYPAAFEFAQNTDIEFKYEIALVEFKGKFAIKTSAFDLNDKEPEASKFNLSFDLSRSSAGFSLATRVMLGKLVLNAKKYPQIIFSSRKIIYANKKFDILGDLTIKNITKPVTLSVTPVGFKAELLDNKRELNFHIFSEINRNDFGASAFPNLVGSKIILDSNIILTRVID